jgi:hypothetical protein
MWREVRGFVKFLVIPEAPLIVKWWMKNVKSVFLKVEKWGTLHPKNFQLSQFIAIHCWYSKFKFIKKMIESCVSHRNFAMEFLRHFYGSSKHKIWDMILYSDRSIVQFSLEKNTTVSIIFLKIFFDFYLFFLKFSFYLVFK